MPQKQALRTPSFSSNGQGFDHPIPAKQNYSAVFLCLVLAAGTWIIYSPVAHHPFVDFDDQYYVTQNVHVQAGLSWQTFVWSFNAGYAQNWHPLTWLSHALDCQLYGLNPAGHHLTNVFFHVLNVVILFLLLLRATGAMWRGLLVAALFALHPLNVESVAWVAERKNVLSTLFFLLALGAYGWYARYPELKRYVVLVVLFVLGLAAKPMVITLPFVLLLLDFWPLQRIKEWPTPAVKDRKEGKIVRSRGSEPEPMFAQASLVRLIQEKLPLLALCVGSVILTVIAQRTVSIRTLERFPMDVRLENAVYAYAMYVWRTFVPLHLALFYPYARQGFAIWKIGLAGLFLVAVSVLVWKERFTRRYLVTGWLWYLGTLVPVIGLVQVGDQAMADRYAYIPVLGIFVIVIWGAADWADRAHVNFQFRAATAVLVLAAFLFLTWRQIGYWRSEYDLWSRDLELAPDNSLAISNLGDAYTKMGHDEDALPLLQKSVQLLEWDPVRHANLAIGLVHLDRLQDAIPEYEVAISLTSDPAMQSHLYDSLAAVYDALDDYPKVHESYQQALKVNPQSSATMIQWLTQSVAAQPSAPRYVQLGILLQESGKAADARAAFEQAVKLDPSLNAASDYLHALTADSKK
jgi:tetratricopeptide (TPR) repeat protein